MIADFSFPTEYIKICLINKKVQLNFLKAFIAILINTCLLIEEYPYS